MKKKYNVAIVGATGAVGNEMIKTLEQRKFPVEKLTLLASERSVGDHLKFNKKSYSIFELKKDSFSGVDIALFSAGASRSKEFAPYAKKAGAVVIDNSSAFRMDKNVPLVVPEVNPHMIKKGPGIIANPNCSTIQLVVALKPIYDVAGIKRIVVSTYQSVSGTGKKAIDELSKQVTDLLSFNKIKCEVYPHQIAFNCLPHIDDFCDDGYTKEEHKVINETKKILEDSKIKVSVTAVRVPVFFSHSEAINIETKSKLTANDARKVLKKFPGIKVIDNVSKHDYPLAISSAGSDEVFVGRIREDNSVKNGLNIWVVSDNLRKGAALNAVQIAEEWIKK